MIWFRCDRGHRLWLGPRWFNRLFYRLTGEGRADRHWRRCGLPLLLDGRRPEDV